MHINQAKINYNVSFSTRVHGNINTIRRLYVIFTQL